MDQLHHKLLKSSPAYRRWHENNNYHLKHWAIFIAVTVVALVSLTNLINRQIVSVDLLQTRAATTITAASCSQADVQAAINSALDGDTVIVPAGTCTWTQTVTVDLATSPKALTIQGAGIDQTILMDNNFSATAEMFKVTTAEGKSFRLTGFTFDGSLGTKTFNAVIVIGGTSKAFRIDHNKFSKNSSNGISASGYLFGVIDHNTFDEIAAQAINVSHGAWGGYSYGDGSWADTLSLGTEKAIYIEDNSFSNTQPTGLGAIDGVGGSRYVFRYNTVYNDGAGHHGTESGGRQRGVFSFEYYNNTFTLPTGVSGVRGLTIRSGTGVIFNNTFSGGYGTLAKLQNFRDWDTYPSWGECDGTSPLDMSDGVLYDSGVHNGSASSTVLTDTTKNWATNQWASGHSVRNVTKGWGSTITSNTPTAISFAPPANNGAHVWDPGDRYEIRKAYPCIDQVGRSTGDLLSGSTPTPQAWPHQTLEPVYEWNNTLNGADFDMSSYSNLPHIQEGRDFFNDTVRPGYTPYVYPHPLVSLGTTTPPPPSPTPTPVPTSTPIPKPSLIPASTLDTTPPTVSITSPLSGSTIPVKTPLTISASATDDVSVSKVDFFINGTLKCSDTTSPYACSWKVPGKAGRTYRLQAQATDTSGNIGTSSITTVTAK